MSTIERTTGWAWPPNSRKAHYFPQGETISLCCRWMYGGERQDFNHESSDNCTTCQQARLKIAKQEARTR